MTVVAGVVLGLVALLALVVAASTPATVRLRPTDVIALYQAKIPDGGYLLNAQHRPLVLGLTLASPLLWLLSDPLWMLARKDDESLAPRSRSVKNDHNDPLDTTQTTQRNISPITFVLPQLDGISS